MLIIQYIFMLPRSSDLYEIVTMGLLLFPKGQVHTN